MCTLLLPGWEAQGGLAARGQEVFRYEIHTLGGPAGEAALTFGRLRALKGHRLRPVKLEARTTGQAQRLYPFLGGGTTWVDESGLTRRIRWDSQMPLGRREVKVHARGKTLKGENVLAGVRKEVDYQLDARPTDLIGAIAWLRNQDLVPGKVYERPVFLGLRVYEMSAEVGEPERVHLPVGLREVFPVRITARGHGKNFRAEAHYTRKGKLPALLRFRLRALGVVEARLAFRQ